MDTRKIAYKILMDIEINKSYSNISLNKFLKNSEIDNSSRGLITEIVYGVVENKIYIDYLINKVSKIKVKKMSNTVKTIIRMGTYQLYFLEGVANYAAINESVNLIKKLDRKSSAFVNAVLRNLSRKNDIIIENPINKEELSTKFSFNNWIVDKLIEDYGFDDTMRIIKSLTDKPRLYARINILKGEEFDTFEELKSYVIEGLKSDGIEVNEVEDFYEAIELKGFKNIDKNRMFIDGYISIQDLSSMMVAKIMNPDKNSNVLDLCSAPGGKTTHIAELLSNTGKVYAHDIYEHKIKLIEAYSNRLGLNNVLVSIQNAEKYNIDYEKKFDYVLCDVPCSGIGIIRRKPEIKYKEKEDIVSLLSIQKKILNNASSYVKNGGILIYSTCTIFKDENEKMIEDFLKENSDFELDVINVKPFEKMGNKGFIQIMPYMSGMDGFFIAKLKRK